MSHIFLSYSRKDVEAARRLYRKMSAAGYPVWFDEESLMVGQRWEDEISKAIQKALGFVALISANSVDQRGYVQKELRLALDELSKTPANQVYLFPVRLNDVRPHEPALEKLQWLDFFPDEDRSLQKLLKALSSIPGLVAAPDKSKPQEKAAAEPEVSRFESMADVFHAFLQRIPAGTPATGAVNAFYVTVDTQHAGVDIPEAQRQRHPKDILFVFEHQYKDLVCGPESFSVTLWFSGVETRITVPYESITEIREPNAHIRIA